MTIMNFVQVITCFHVACSKKSPGKEGKAKKGLIMLGHSLDYLFLSVCSRVFLLTMHQGYVLTLLNY